MEFVTLGRWGDLRPGVNVLTVTNEAERLQLISQFEEVFAASDMADSPAVKISGASLVLDANLRRTLRDNLAGVSPIVSTRSGKKQAVHPAAISIESAVEVMKALSDFRSSPKEPSVEVFRRMHTLQTEAADQDTSQDKVSSVDLAAARRDIAALRKWIEQLNDGFDRIDAAQVIVTTHEAAAYKKFAGPTAFNRLLDAQGVRDEIVVEVGFESYEVYVAEKLTVMSDAVARLDASQRQLQTLESTGLDRREVSGRPESAEMDFLSAHVNFEERYGNDPNKSPAEQNRSRTVVRTGIRKKLALFLDSLGVTGTGEVEAVAQQFLDSMRVGSSLLPSEMKAAIAMRLASLDRIPAFGSVPCVLDDVFVGWEPSEAHEMFAHLVDLSKAGQQVLYVCTREEALRVSPLTQLFERSAALAR